MARHQPEAPGANVPAAVVLVTGVAGSGKSTVARLLAGRLGWAYQDADDFHTPANRARMAAGESLTDEDRRPWLAAVAAWIGRRIAAREPAVVACSALKRAYRDQLAGGRPEVRLVHLHGSRQLIRSRLQSRHGHFFPAQLLDSQFADLQEPEPDEHACVVDIDQPPEAVVAAVVAQLCAVPTEEPHMPPTASGEQWRLRHGEQAAVVVELGGALRHYEVGGRPLLDGFAADEPITGGRGQLLVPWPNRVKGGRYGFGGEDRQLPLTEPENDNAIHGLLRWVPWRLLARSEDAVTVGTVLYPQPGYPYRLEVAAEYRLGREGLETTVTTTNAGDTAAPYGVGQHPYLTVGTDLVDTALLTVPARQRLVTDEHGLPTGEEPVDGTPYDFRTARPIGEQRLDTAYTELDRDPAGRCAVRLAHPSGLRGIDVRLIEGVRYVQVYTGDTLPEPGRRRRGVAIEPMSCPADALRSGTALTVLEPGGSHVFRWCLAPWGSW
ncbi:gluconokinase, GntK/IdnK-type [Streptomyces sp. NBC_00162]|uniref:gluconokinase, GntK/IdnK-type n=1 Tax=Streptomyces sp. NBC_00162 TaxID=2903629 RepID=UPI00214C4FFA|nr:gluconokinase, GntK/IdnK-type [Streptomyces sp. NBC_00162]UUU38820.1 gluconokinase, GntK/IdnK-type [Streptomyces sp. NBC_00162]